MCVCGTIFKLFWDTRRADLDMNDMRIAPLFIFGKEVVVLGVEGAVGATINC